MHVNMSMLPCIHASDSLISMGCWTINPGVRWSCLISAPGGFILPKMVRKQKFGFTPGLYPVTVHSHATAGSGKWSQMMKCLKLALCAPHPKYGHFCSKTKMSMSKTPNSRFPNGNPQTNGWSPYNYVHFVYAVTALYIKIFPCTDSWKSSRMNSLVCYFIELYPFPKNKKQWDLQPQLELTWLRPDSGRLPSGSC